MRSFQSLLLIQLLKQKGVTVYTTVSTPEKAALVREAGADAASRIIGQPRFDGHVREGLLVLIVDDVVTYGSTLANLRGWIEHNGGIVVGATTLAAAYGSTKLKPTAELTADLIRKYPESRDLANILGFGPEQFTGRNQKKRK